jgi:aminoglycoside 2'-N-acetyltransferase I
VIRFWAGDTADFLAEGWEVAARGLMQRAFDGDFSDDDWEHGLGGRHFLVLDDQLLVAHASVVERPFGVAGRGTVRTGYLEAVATEPARQGEGHGSMVVRAATGHVREGYELGALSTGEPGFYERLGWQRWRGKTFVDAAEGRLRTAEEDDGVLVLLTDRTEDLDLSGDLVCDWRRGDVW